MARSVASVASWCAPIPERNLPLPGVRAAISPQRATGQSTRRVGARGKTKPKAEVNNRCRAILRVESAAVELAGAAARATPYRGARPCRHRWACGRTRAIEQGSRAFFMRLGVPPKGLIGAGYALTEPWEDIHWLADKAAAGVRTHYLKLRLDALFDRRSSRSTSSRGRRSAAFAGRCANRARACPRRSPKRSSRGGKRACRRATCRRAARGGDARLGAATSSSADRRRGSGN